MKLLRYRANNLVKPAILDNTGKIKDVSSIVNDWNGKTLNDETINNVKNYEVADLPTIEENISIAPCVGEVGKFICIGLNYSDHAKEAGAEVPKEPLVL